MKAEIGIPAKYDLALHHVAAGMTHKLAAKAAGISRAHLTRCLHSPEGSARYEFWLRQELRAIAPRAVQALDRSLDSRNANAAVRAAEAILDRTGLGEPIQLGGGSITVSFDIAPRETETAKVIEHGEVDSI
jgi:hypothetical protein